MKNKMETIWIIAILALIICSMTTCSGRRSTSQDSNDRSATVAIPEPIFGDGYPVHYEIAYMNMFGFEKAPTVYDLFGPKAPLKTSSDEGQSIMVIESTTGNNDEFTVTFLWSMIQAGKKLDVARIQFKFTSDNFGQKSYARYYKMANLVTGKHQEFKSRGNEREDGNVLGALYELLAMGWDLSNWQ